MGNKDARRYPVISLGAEHLLIGHLLRRNILTYKAPPNNEGYDLICIHPDPRKSSAQIRVQVKSRYQTDSDRAFPLKDKSFGAFEYLIVVFLNNATTTRTALFAMDLANPSSTPSPSNSSRSTIKKPSQDGKGCLRRGWIWISIRTNEGLRSSPMT